MIYKKYEDPACIDKETWKEILTDRQIAGDEILDVLNCLYHMPGYKLNGKEIARKLNYKHHARLNLLVPEFVDKIRAKHDLKGFPVNSEGKIRRWHVPFNGTEEKSGKKILYFWILREELARAIQEIGLFNNRFPDELPEKLAYREQLNEKDEIFKEGICKQVIVNSYERNLRARAKCLEAHGYDCSVCGFNFEKHYGELGKDMIHVHHVKSLSSIGKEYRINPIEDLLPVCPNCHAMIHRNKNNPLSIDELREIVKANNTP